MKTRNTAYLGAHTTIDILADLVQEYMARYALTRVDAIKAIRSDVWSVKT